MWTRTFFGYHLSPRTKVHKYKSRKLSTKGPKAPRPQNETKIISSMMQQEGRGNPTHYAQMDEQEREATILGYTDTWRLVVYQWQYVRYSSINRKKAGQYYVLLCRSFLYTRQRGMSMVLLGRKNTISSFFSTLYGFQTFLPYLLIAFCTFYQPIGLAAVRVSTN